MSGLNGVFQDYIDEMHSDFAAKYEGPHYGPITFIFDHWEPFRQLCSNLRVHTYMAVTPR